MIRMIEINICLRCLIVLDLLLIVRNDLIVFMTKDVYIYLIILICLQISFGFFKFSNNNNNYYIIKCRMQRPF